MLDRRVEGFAPGPVNTGVVYESVQFFDVYGQDNNGDD